MRKLRIRSVLAGFAISTTVMFVLDNVTSELVPVEVWIGYDIVVVAAVFAAVTHLGVGITTTLWLTRYELGTRALLLLGATTTAFWFLLGLLLAVFLPVPMTPPLIVAASLAAAFAGAGAVAVGRRFVRRDPVRVRTIGQG